MTDKEGLVIYVCPRCLMPEAAEGNCERCGVPRQRCCLGEARNEARRPLFDSEGRVQTRAPRWWLRHSVALLIDRLEE